ncbi:MAG TPA: VIT1/CCC1 transporter family protein [Acetobacteraceae bacterium]|nr:VIT1/CCC1 transporter family protein [Acetobacteraceae bacterium]
MPTIPHIEKHFRASAAVRDLVIGMSDGLTVPFALVAGLSGAVEAGRRGDHRRPGGSRRRCLRHRPPGELTMRPSDPPIMVQVAFRQPR